jgi:hypothetical protein
MVRGKAKSIISRIAQLTFLISLDFLYEMGGTWVTHHMGYLFREMVRYGMDRDLITTGSPNMEKGFYTINVAGEFLRCEF